LSGLAPRPARASPSRRLLRRDKRTQKLGAARTDGVDPARRRTFGRAPARELRGHGVTPRTSLARRRPDRHLLHRVRRRPPIRGLRPEDSAFASLTSRRTGLRARTGSSTSPTTARSRPRGFSSGPSSRPRGALLSLDVNHRALWRRSRAGVSRAARAWGSCSSGSRTRGASSGSPARPKRRGLRGLAPEAMSLTLGDQGSVVLTDRRRRRALHETRAGPGGRGRARRGLHGG
jgi:hypothetical protein